MIAISDTPLQPENLTEMETGWMLLLECHVEQISPERLNFFLLLLLTVGAFSNPGIIDILIAKLPVSIVF